TLTRGGPCKASGARRSARASGPAKKIPTASQLARLAMRTAAVLMIAGPSGCDSHVHLGMIRDGGGSGAAGGSGGSGSDAGDGGAAGNLLWSATFEPGDLSEW